MESGFNHLSGGPEQNDAADGPPFGPTLAEDLDWCKGARSLSCINTTYALVVTPYL